MSSYLPKNAAEFRLVMLSGSEETLRRRTLANLLDLDPGDSFDTQSITAGETAPMEWISSASTVPFLSEKRTVIVRNAMRAGPPAEAFRDPVEAFKSLPASARLILVADDEASTEHDRIQKHERIKTAWEGIVRKAGGLVVEFKLDPKALKSDVLKAAGALDKKLSDRATELLLEMTGRSLSRAIEELDKLAAYVGDAEAIREEDVEEVVLPSREWNVFKLVDSILEANVGQALTQLRMLVGSGTKAENAAMQNIFPNLSRNLRLIWQARVVLDHRANLNALPSEVKALLPEQGSLTSISEWQQRRAMGGARKLNLNQIAECMEILARTDARLKGLEPSFSASDALERMVLEMVDVVRPVAAR